MAGKRTSPRRPGLVWVGVGVTPADREILRRMADREGVSVSHLCARVLRRLVDVETHDPVRETPVLYRSDRWSGTRASR